MPILTFPSFSHTHALLSEISRVLTKVLALLLALRSQGIDVMGSLDGHESFLSQCWFPALKEQFSTFKPSDSD